MTRRRAIALLLALAAIALLPRAADLLRGEGARCAHDGVPVAASGRVRFEFGDGSVREYCGLPCADAALARGGEIPLRVLVADARDGTLIDARKAAFVRVFLAASGGPREACRAFARREDAVRYAEVHRGKLLEGNERPLAGRPGDDDASKRRD